MNVNKLDSAVSPSRAGNFVISYTQEVEILKNIQTESLIQFLDSEQTSSTSILCETDRSFFPRAFTDTGLIEQQFTSGESLYEQSSSAKKKGLASKTMSVKGNGRFGGGAFQPDVITSNSHQRSGPDGSPALAPTRSQGFVAPTNLSETGELFAPVRTLTFSDIDQSSQIEDGYVNNSRLVSTPSKSERVTNYDYNSIYNSQSQNMENEEDILAEYSDSSDSDIINRMRGSESPVFRQLEGEADNDLMKTGPFHPSAHGLSKEFMDNFVGKTGNQAALGDNGDIFSPLGSNPYAERQIHSVTPPLHSPGPNSPYAKRYNSPRNKKSPRMERSPRGRPSPKGEAEPRKDHDEIQFAMSPTKNQPDIHPFDKDMLALGNQNMYKQGFQGQEKFYIGKQTSENSFVPIEKQPHTFNPASVPKNLNEYFEQVTSDEFLMSRNKQTNLHEKDEENEINNRQGDGTDNNADDSHHRHCSSPDPDNQFSVVSPSSFEQRYLQKTQVSVKLPQATYDTISANTSHNEKFASGDHAHHDRNDTSYFPPDVAAADAEYRPVAGNSAKSSPGKVMDLLQNQVSKLKDTPEEANDGSRDREVKKKDENLGSSHMSAKSKDTNNINFKLNTAIKNNLHTDANQHDNTSGSDNTGQSGKHQLMMSQSLVSNAPKQNNVNVKQSESFQAGGQSQLPVTSRLLQETVSQRNKTTQKFVSSAPSLSKPVANNQNKEFKKPYDVCPKNQNLACSGARKTLPNENGAKFKVSDKTKTKSVSTESLNSKQRTVQNHSKNLNVGNSQEKVSQSRYLTQPKNQSALSQNQGNSARGQQLQNSQGQAMVDGHNGSMGSVEDEGQGHGHIVTQVETTSPVPVEQPRQNIRCRQVE